MKSGFYPYSGPARKDNPLRPYPKWYYPNADGTGICVHSVEEYLYAVDSCCRNLFSGSYHAQKPELWFRGLKSEKQALLPAIAISENDTPDGEALVSETLVNEALVSETLVNETPDEKTLLEKFAADSKEASGQPYPQLLLLMYKNGVPTRLMEWAVDAVTALKNAVDNDEHDTENTSNAAVWCLSQSALNQLSYGNDLSWNIPDISDTEAGALFGSDDNVTDGDNHPFAVYSEQSGEKKSAFTVFQRGSAVTALEKLDGSNIYLSKITIQHDARSFIIKQLQRYGLL